MRSGRFKIIQIDGGADDAWRDRRRPGQVLVPVKLSVYVPASSSRPLRLTVTVALPSVIFATGTVPLRMTVPFS